MKIRMQISRIAVFSLLFALCPFLMNYHIPFTQTNLTVAIFLGVFIVEFIRATRRPGAFQFRSFYPAKLFFIYFAFIVINHFNVFYKGISARYGMSPLVNIFLLIIELAGIILFFEDVCAIACFRKCLESVAVLMALIVIIECVMWYGFHVYPAGGNHQLTLPFLSAESYDNLSAIVSPTGLFRPSAFFLEPAHFSNYCVVALASTLFDGTDRLFSKKSVIITIALLLTLSGFGIMLAALVWGIYLIIGAEKRGSKHAERNIILIVTAVLLVVVAYAIFPPFRSALARFTGAEGDNGVYGRLGNYYMFVEKLRGFSRIWGVGYGNLPLRAGTSVTHYFTGILELMYCQGVVGAALFSILYVLMMIKAFIKRNMLAFTVSVIGLVFVIGSAFFSATSMLNYIPFLFAVDYRKRTERGAVIYERNYRKPDIALDENVATAEQGCVQEF